ncbi:hypothetical protein HIM_05826 [Hirsutella minnesotensis 3608]|uniref:Trichodiene oxygenase n=1 Tax=Hirsutella minnesotensis 3608 TaxID=1043627 RepID=A0A0F8A549_9HYPO|nr:hypothetical protein HIM_05826 [Hirsutella minnesotensis 3608]
MSSATRPETEAAAHPYRAGAIWQHLLLHLVACYAIYIVLLFLYRITLHPLAGFPGPKIAGASYCYEFWFDVIRQGRYTREIVKLHARYGPIVRINPDELHCNDPAFMNEIYASGNRKRNKSKHFCASFPSDTRMGAGGTADHSLHRLRISEVNRFFSRSQVIELEDLIQLNAQKLCDKLLAYRGCGPLDAADAFNCFTTDTLTEYCFGNSTGFLDQPGWEPNYNKPLDVFFSMVHILRHFPWLTYLMERVPLPAVKVISTNIWQLLHHIKVEIPQQIQSMQDNFDGNTFKGRRTIFLQLLNSNLPAQEKTLERLAGEAHTILVGGTGSTTTALCALTYHLLSNPPVRSKLTAELSTVMSDPAKPPCWSTLERLPYFNAFVHEGLRLMHGSSQRLPRVATEEDLVYEGSWKPSPTSPSTNVTYVVPRGYAIGMSAYIMHSDESIFPNASEFIPERWFHQKGEKDLGRYLFTFAKGSRQCVAMQLAYAEFYICMAALTMRVLPFMELYQTKLSDIEYDHDEVIAKPKRGSKGFLST